MPDIREEFEAWQVKTGRTDPIWFGAASFDDRKREYVLDQINRDWIVWQASRTALKVEMPPRVTAEDVAEHLEKAEQHWANENSNNMALIAEVERLTEELSACTEHPGGCGYWREAAKRRAEERDRLKAENEALRSALQAVHAEVDGNIRPLTRDLVNMVSGVKNGSHPNDIYDHCDEIDRIIDAALEGGGK